MDAIILSAGRGLRLRPLTEKTPKPLIRVGKHSLVEHHLYRLGNAGIDNVVINTSYLAEQFVEVLGDGTAYGVNVLFSHEGDDALETGGGIVNALSLIQSDPFLIISADIWIDFRFNQIEIPINANGCIVLVDNPPHNREGDFVLSNGKVELATKAISNHTLTYSGIAMMRQSCFRDLPAVRFPLAEVFHDLIGSQSLAGYHYHGQWLDVGTSQRLDELREMLVHECQE